MSMLPERDPEGDLPRGLRVEDLPPRDRARGLPPLADLLLHVVTGPEDPWFDRAYAVLHAEFGPLGELEPRDVLIERLRRGTEVQRNGWRCRYALMVLYRAGDDQPFAVRDHTAILSEPNAAESMGVVVHLSHALVWPGLRGRGLGAWLRALPITTARQLPGVNENTPVTLVAEMEHPGNPPTPEQVNRLQLYERAGFVMLDPQSVDYVQPDFRAAKELGDDGPHALSLRLLLRIVGQPVGETLPASCARAVVTALYRMYDLDLAPAAMEQAWKNLQACPLGHADVPLLPPTTGCVTTPPSPPAP